MKKIAEKTGRPYIYDFFVEFEARETRDAKFAKFVDGLEAQNHIINNKCKGFNKEEDIKRGFYVSQGGITVVPKDAILSEKS